MEKHAKKGEGEVAVFDSGIGGLNVLYACAARFANLDFCYVSDNANVPYGSKRGEEIFALATRALDAAAEREPVAAIVACNTATARCIGDLRSRYPFPIVGMQPAVKPAAERGGECLVLATPSTANSPSFRDLLSRCGGARFTVCPCPELASYIEDNIFNIGETLPDGLLPPFGADSVVLGCTHYVFAERQIGRRYNCPIFDGISGTVNHLAEILGISDHVANFGGIFSHQGLFKPNITFLTGDIDKNKVIFQRMLEREK